VLRERGEERRSGPSRKKTAGKGLIDDLYALLVEGGATAISVHASKMLRTEDEDEKVIKAETTREARMQRLEKRQKKEGRRGSARRRPPQSERLFGLKSRRNSIC